MSLMTKRETRADSLTDQEILSAIGYGEMIDVRVTRTTKDGCPAVWFRDSEPFTDYYKAMAALQLIAANEVCAGEEAFA